MAVLSITIPDEHMPRVLAAMSQTFGYQATLGNGQPNPQTELQFVREQIKAWMRETLRIHEGRVAVENARTTAEANIPTF